MSYFKLKTSTIKQFKLQKCATSIFSRQLIIAWKKENKDCFNSTDRLADTSQYLDMSSNKT